MGEAPALTTEERNIVRYFWSQLHWTPDEFEEYSAMKTRMEDIRAAAESVNLGAGENQEYVKLSRRSTELVHDILGKRVIITHDIRDRVWPELAPRVLRFRKFMEKPSDQLSSEENKELETLLEWFNKLQREAVRNVKPEP